MKLCLLPKLEVHTYIYLVIKVILKFWHIFIVYIFLWPIEVLTNGSFTSCGLFASQRFPSSSSLGRFACSGIFLCCWFTEVAELPPGVILISLCLTWPTGWRSFSLSPSPWLSLSSSASSPQSPCIVSLEIQHPVCTFQKQRHVGASKSSCRATLFPWFLSLESMYPACWQYFTVAKVQGLNLTQIINAGIKIAFHPLCRSC